MNESESILFVCVENAGRSQMAKAFAKNLSLNAESAGTIPSQQLNPIAVEVMREKGIRLDDTPKLLTKEMIDGASLVITMGCSVEEACPKPILAQMQKKLIDWSLEDPKGKPISEVRKVRDEIEKRVAGLCRLTRPRPTTHD